jgi:sugar phosphate isomerase/epimerase
VTIFSLAHLTVLDTPPPQMVRMAARLGYDRVGLRLIRVTYTTPGYPLHDDPAQLRETIQALRDTGLTVNDIEFVRLTPDFRVDAMRPFLAAGAELGARHVICAPYDPDLSRLTNNLAALQAEARRFGLSCVLEFFPWTVVPDLAKARQVVQAAGPEVGILLDTLHFDRSNSSLLDLAALPPARLPFVHLCDATVHPPYSTDDLLHAGRAERLPPGDGQIPLRSILERLPEGIPISLEVPMTGRQASLGSAAVAAAVLEKARDLLRTVRC